MPVMCQLGPAVPAGLTRYASVVFGSDYRDSFFAAIRAAVPQTPLFSAR